MCRVGRLRLVCDMASDLKFALRQSPLLNLLHSLRVNTATRAATDLNAATDLAYYVALNILTSHHTPQRVRLQGHWRSGVIVPTHRGVGR